MASQDSYDLKRPDFDAAEFAWKVSEELFLDQFIIDNSEFRSYIQEKFPEILSEQNSDGEPIGNRALEAFPYMV